MLVVLVQTYIADTQANDQGTKCKASIPDCHCMTSILTSIANFSGHAIPSEISPTIARSYEMGLSWRVDQQGLS